MSARGSHISIYTCAICGQRLGVKQVEKPDENFPYDFVVNVAVTPCSGCVMRTDMYLKEVKRIARDSTPGSEQL